MFINTQGSNGFIAAPVVTVAPLEHALPDQMAPVAVEAPVWAMPLPNAGSEGWTIIMYLLTALGLWALDGMVTLIVNRMGSYLVKQGLQGKYY